MGAAIRNPAVLALALGHMAVDILNSSLAVLLVAFAATLGLSNVEIGTVATAYTLASALTQPGFGWVADRWPSRWVGVGGMVWLAAGFALAALLPGRAAFVAFTVAALGSAAFHPQGTMNARRAAGAHAASATSLFFFFGQSGLALGPLLAGLLLARLPLAPTIGLLVAGFLPVVVLVARFAPRERALRAMATARDGGGAHPIAWTPFALAAFVAVLFFRGWPPAATTTFLPKWLADAGFASEQFGAMVGLFMFASALGNVAGGWLADRWSRKGVVVLPLALAPLPFVALYLSPSVGPVALAATVLAGLAMGMPHSVMVLMGQNLFPGRMGLGSGLVLGFMFSVGAVTVWLTGWLGDAIGLQRALALLPWVCAAGALCALALPRTRPQRGVTRRRETPMAQRETV